MAEKVGDLKSHIKSLKISYQNHILKAQHKSDADTELLEILREYAQVYYQFYALEKI